jgi:hypothetical protein
MRMRASYNQVVRKLEREPNFCQELEEARLQRWKDKFGPENKGKVGSTYG